MKKNAFPNDLEHIYNKSYYERLRPFSSKSAKVIVPILIELLKPVSVVDLGCGDGSWLREFIDQGISEVLGIDVGILDPQSLQIPIPNYLQHDLRFQLNITKKYDLAMSLEVAEHIPIEFAKHFVDQLTQLSDKILFSSAIPLQPGEYHINPQWQDWWANLFKEKGYTVFDIIRPKIWDNKQVDWWYAQDTLIYISDQYLQKNPLSRDYFISHQQPILSITHPQCYLYQWTFNQLFSKLPIAAWQGIKKHLNKIFN